MPATTFPLESSPADVDRARELSESNVGAQLRVLFIQHCADRTGSTISGKLAVAGFRKAGWDVDVAFGFDGPMIEEYEGLGCRTHVVPHKNWLRGGGVLRSLRQMLAEHRSASGFERLIRDVLPDVVYVNSLVSLAGSVAARRAQLPCVWHVRELFNDVGGEMRVPGFGGRALVRRLLFRLSTRRVAISRVVADNVLGDPRVVCTELVPNAVADEFFELADDVDSCRRRFDLPRGVPIIGVPGTLRPVKGHTFFLEAAATVARTGPACVFAITGTGTPAYVASLEKLAADLGIGERVRFLGTVADMPRFYRACDVTCVPSESESFGRTVIESMAVGTPVVATAVGGMRETIQPGVSGLLVNYGDVPALSCAILDVLSEPSMAAALTGGGRRLARAEYSAERCQERLVRIVRSAVDEVRDTSGKVHKSPRA